MNFSSDKELLITQLIRETVSGSVSWSVKNPPYSLNQATENFIPLYLECQYKNARIGVYEVRQKTSLMLMSIIGVKTWVFVLFNHPMSLYGKRKNTLPHFESYFKWLGTKHLEFATYLEYNINEIANHWASFHSIHQDYDKGAWKS